MKKLKKSLCYIIPLLLVVVIALAFVPMTFALETDNSADNQFDANSDFNGQVVYAVTDTGASSAARAYKGGSVFLEPHTNMTINGVTISGHKNTYGGAIYISNGATLTMKGGTITNNSATYGGAIYVEAGGKCIIDGGTIKGNKAQTAPAIYVEEGATFQFLSGTIENNTSTSNQPSTDREYYAGYILDDYFLAVINMTILKSKGFTATSVSSTKEKLILPTMQFGSYPQSYVGDEMNETLTQWKESSSPEVTTTYNVGDRDWQAYKYTDGKIYVYGQSVLDHSVDDAYGYVQLGLEFTYKDGSTLKLDDEYAWFEVEPINWFILNYDKWQAGEEDVELLSEIVLAGNVAYDLSSSAANWDDCSLRSWLNDEFYNTAFSSSEQAQIETKTNLNSTDTEYEEDPSNWTAAETQDNVYLLSYYDVFHEGSMWENEITLMVTNEAMEGTMAYPMSGNTNLAACSLSDFAISNNCVWGPIGTCSYRMGTSFVYMFRTISSSVNVKTFELYRDYHQNWSESSGGIRPAIQLNV